MSCQKKLQYLIHDNFIAYHHAHIDHFNVTGPHFNDYHSLLQEVYESLYSWFDKLSEQLRTMGEFVDGTIDLDKQCLIEPHDNGRTTSIILNRSSYNLEVLIKCGNALYKEAGKEGHGALETIVGDYLVDLNKLKWKVDSCLTNP